NGVLPAPKPVPLPSCFPAWPKPDKAPPISPDPSSYKPLPHLPLSLLYLLLSLLYTDNTFATPHPHDYTDHAHTTLERPLFPHLTVHVQLFLYPNKKTTSEK